MPKPHRLTEITQEINSAVEDRRPAHRPCTRLDKMRELVQQSAPVPQSFPLREQMLKLSRNCSTAWTASSRPLTSSAASRESYNKRRGSESDARKTLNTLEWRVPRGPEPLMEKELQVVGFRIGMKRSVVCCRARIVRVPEITSFKRSDLIEG